MQESRTDLKPFPSPGHVWEVLDGRTNPASNQVMVIGLTWSGGEAKAVLHDGSLKLVREIMEDPAWQCAGLGTHALWKKALEALESRLEEAGWTRRQRPVGMAWTDPFGASWAPVTAGEALLREIERSETVEEVMER